MYGQWSYSWLHIPTGTRGTRVSEGTLTRLAFLELVRRWNEQQPGVWQYW